MTEQHVSTNSTPDEDQNKFYLNTDLFGALGDLNRTSPKVVSVMLALVSFIDSKGAVETTQATVAQQCKITLRGVVEAIADLSSAGLISSVKLSPKLGGSLTCVVSPGLATAEKPEDYV